jgi:hypothetical protein
MKETLWCCSQRLVSRRIRRGVRRLFRFENRRGVIQRRGVDLGRGAWRAARNNCKGLERVDVHLCGGQRCLRGAVGEARGVHVECEVERFLPDGMHRGHPFEEDFCGREERESGVVMVVVMPPEELLEHARAWSTDPKRPG